MRGASGMLAAMLALTGAMAASAVAEEPGKQAPAQACDITRTKTDYGHIHAAGGWEAECREGRGCAIRGPEVNGHRLQFSHPLADEHWSVVLTLPRAADAQAGVELVVDTGEPMRVPYEFLHVKAGGRVIGIRPEVVEIVLDALRKGRKLEWRYTDEAGKGESVTFDISCLGPGGLLKLAETSLARMRAMKQMGK